MPNISPAYVAGYIDADGCIFTKLSNRNPGEIRLCVSIAAASYTSTLKAIQDEYGGGLLVESMSPPNRDLHRLTWWGNNDTRKILSVVGPYIVSKTRQVELAEAILHHLDSYHRRTDALIKMREKWHARMKEMNKLADANKAEEAMLDCKIQLSMLDNGNRKIIV